MMTEPAREMPAGLIIVGDTTISEQMIAREMQHHRAASHGEAWQMAAEALAVRELLLAEARREGLTGGDETVADDPAIAALIAREVRCPEPDDEICQRYFKKNPQLFRSLETFHARHILIASPEDDTDARSAGMTLAAELIAILQADIGRFDELAQRFSACPSRERGGRLGPVSRGDTVPEFETFLFSLAQGELCPLPIQTRYGVHVMRLDSRASAEPVSYDLVRDRIAEFLRARSLHTALRQYITILAGRTNIEGLGISAAHSPLVQ